MTTSVRLAFIFLGVFLYACTPSKTDVSEKDNDTQGALVGSDAVASEEGKTRPNVLLIITDDQGYGDLGHTGNDVIETPTLDELFHQGVSFDRFYVSPVCAPTRASLLTGKHYLSTGVFHVTRGQEKMHAQNTTLAELLKAQGYRTALFGKWHNGLQFPHDPVGQGFDEFYGFSAGHLSEYYDNYLYHSSIDSQTQRVKYTGYVADVITDEALRFVKQDSEAASPFFAMLSFNTPHGPFQVPDHYFQKYKDKGMKDVDASIYGMVENIDDNVKRVLDALDERGELDNTIVLYMSDNGAAFPDGQSRYNAGLRGHKGLVDEGGVRSPFVIHWPDAGLAAKEVMPITQHIDVVPTLLSLLDIDFDPESFDGRDLSVLMEQDNAPWEPRNVYSHRFRISADPSVPAVQLTPAAIRTQQHLAMAGENGIWQLYDLLDDPGQTRDLAKEKVQLLSDLKAQYETWFKEITQAHGEYTTIPVEVGHLGRDTVELPAHEGLIKQDLAYKHGMGWSHDWLIPTSQEKGSAHWPLNVVSEGNYAVQVDYTTAGEAYSGEIQVLSPRGKLVKTQVPSFVSETLSTDRQYFTNEAPDLTWKTIEMGELSLSEGEQSLEIEFSKDESNREIWIKQVRLVKR
ncbi:arylsulfatase [Ningiella sp. W23]|uniref:arylsulfatase n=1 Tax=Ningiella sp. W23 TaxID=3023715 RepID=UPI003756D0A6